MGCNGGQPSGAWRFFAKQGLPTGGDYEDVGAGTSCKPYSLPTCFHHGDNTLGLAACVAVVVFNTNMKPVELGAKSQHAHKVHKAMKKGLGLKHSDMSLLASAMADQSKEKHAACLKECTTKDCKKACGALAPGAKAKAAKTMAQARKKGLGLKKGDLSLLKDAQKARHAEEVKHCKACVSAECKANCKATMAAAKKSAKVQLSQKKVNLGLKTSDLKLLQDAEKRQGREEKMIKAMHAHDAKFLHKGGKEIGRAHV